MNKSKIILIICLSVALGIFVVMLPSAQLERHVDIRASVSVVMEKTKLFETAFDSATLNSFKFDFKTTGDSTRLICLYTMPEMDDPIVKVAWLFEKDKLQTAIDKGLSTIKRVSESKQ